MTARPDEPLPAGLVAGLARGEAHPEDASAHAGVEWIQTHISHVFLTGARVVKLRKAVAPGFLDFSTRALRNADCLNEVRLNRRLAPDVYLGVAPIERAGGSWRLGAVAEALADRGPEGDALEHAVVMRRLPRATDALSRIASGRLSADQIDRAARCIAAFHADHGLGAPAPFSPERWRARIRAPMDGMLEGLRRSAVPEAPPERLAAFDAIERRCFASLSDLLERRRLAGCAVDGHGDLHLDHLWFESDTSPPLFIDCIEFSDELRHIDAASEVAFLSMDLRYRGQAELAERFLRVYAETSGDFALYGVVDWFESYRAVVRAGVAALAATDAGIAAAQRRAAGHSVRAHLALAERALAGRPPGTLILVAGFVGAGKSSVARALADRIGGVVLASDVLRKRRRGLAPTARVAAGGDLYSAAAKAETYRALLECAEAIVQSGRCAILDATWSRRQDRAAARAWAARRGLEVHLVEVRAEESVARARLARRQTADTDASDAGPEILAQSAREFEAFDAEVESERSVVFTDRPDWEAGLDAIVRKLAWPRAPFSEMP